MTTVKLPRGQWEIDLDHNWGQTADLGLFTTVGVRMVLRSRLRGCIYGLKKRRTEN